VNKRIAVAVSLLAVSAVAGVIGWTVLRPDPWYVAAVGSLPQETARATFTDWVRVGEQVGEPTEGTELSPEKLDALLVDAYDRGLLELSAIHDSSQALLELYDFTPFDLQWEIYGQSETGAVDVLKFGDHVDLGKFDDRLRDLGYEAPTSDRAAWYGDPDILAGLSIALTPIQQGIVILPDEHLVLMSANPDYAARSAKVITGDAPSLRDVDGVEDLASAPVAPVSALLWARDFACEDLAMSQADGTDQQLAEELVDEAGGVDPLAGLVMAQEASGEFFVSMRFASDDQAEANLGPRESLARGDAPGQGGSFPERFVVEQAEVDGRFVTLVLDSVDERSLMTDISSGPVLFATC
jgi:hypothetical protein